MGLVLSIILVLVVVLILYNHIVNHIPKRWRVLGSGSSSHRATGAQEESQAPVYGPVLPNASANYWLVSQNGANSRAVRAFSTPIRSAGQVYDAPLLYFSCYDGQLYSWLDTRLRAASAPTETGAVRISVNGAAAQLWPREAGSTLAAPNPRRLLSLAEKGGYLTIRLAFEGAPMQTLTLLLTGPQALQQAVTCVH